MHTNKFSCTANTSQPHSLKVLSSNLGLGKNLLWQMFLWFSSVLPEQFFIISNNSWFAKQGTNCSPLLLTLPSISFTSEKTTYSFTYSCHNMNLIGSQWGISLLISAENILQNYQLQRSKQPWSCYSWLPMFPLYCDSDNINPTQYQTPYPESSGPKAFQT